MESPFISETVRSMPIIIYYRSPTGSHRQPIDPCQFPWLWMTLKGSTPIFFWGSPYVGSYRTTKLGVIGSHTIPIPRGGASALLQNWGPPTFAYTLWQAVTKFCTVIDVHEIKNFLQDRSRPLPWPIIFVIWTLTRDLFVVNVLARYAVIVVKQSCRNTIPSRLTTAATKHTVINFLLINNVVTD